MLQSNRRITSDSSGNESVENFQFLLLLSVWNAFIWKTLLCYVKCKCATLQRSVGFFSSFSLVFHHYMYCWWNFWSKALLCCYCWLDWSYIANMLTFLLSCRSAVFVALVSRYTLLQIFDTNALFKGFHYLSLLCLFSVCFWAVDLNSNPAPLDIWLAVPSGTATFFLQMEEKICINCLGEEELLSHLLVVWCKDLRKKKKTLTPPPVHH